MSDQQTCSFCGKGRNEVDRLVAGPRVYICNECVALYGDILGIKATAEPQTQLTLTFPVPKDQIPNEVRRLSDEVKKSKAVMDLACKLLDLVRGCCDHAGQVTGSNDRDGSWGNPCPTCGYSF